MAQRRIGILINSGSGRRREADPGDVAVKRLRERGLDVTLRRLDRESSIGEQTRRLVDEGFETIVAGGGDGTICGVAAALADSNTVLGVLPLGTFNYFARSLDIPDDLDEAIDVLARGRAVPIRIGKINDKVFLNNTSIGRYPEILARREGVYKRWGRSRLAAYWSVLVTLLTLRRPLDLTIDADGEISHIRTPLVFVLNNVYQLSEMGLVGGETIAKGKLAMYLSPDTGRFGLLRQALALAMGTAQETRDFHLLSARKFVVESRRRRHPVALDGERVSLRAPLEIVVRNSALEVIVPDSYREATR